MKGLMINGFKDIELKKNIPIPELSDGEVLIKVKYAGICGSDLHHYHNPKAPISGKPTIFGHEFVGFVIASAMQCANEYQVGDFVTAIPYSSCNHCDYCMNGRKSLCDEQVFLGVTTNGVYTEYVKVDGHNVFKFDEGVDKKIATLCEPLAVAIYDVKRSGLSAGQSVFISGGGPIGILIGMIAKLSGAANIVFSEININRIQYLRDIGYTVYNPMQCDVVEEAIKSNKSKKFDISFEVSGAQPSYDVSFRVLKKGGRFMPVALTSSPRSISMFDVTRSQVEIIGINLYEEIDFKRALEIINNGKLNGELSSLITDVFSLEKAKEAYLFAGNPEGKHIKVIIDCDQ
jgi:2-desacetyl-2-hydroxyethyl bacteriochlorophyllide A dehydrogenase